MSATAEAQPPNGRRRWLLLLPLAAAFAALGILATAPVWALDDAAVPPTGLAASATPTEPPHGSVAEVATGPLEPLVAPSAAPKAEAFVQGPAPKIKPPPKPKVGGSYTRSEASKKTVTTSSGATVNVCSPAAMTSTSVSSAPYSSVEQANLDLMNAWREGNGEDPLSWSSSHANKARAWAVHLAKNDCPLAHSNIWDDGENVYWLSGGSSSIVAEWAFNGFKGSPGHNANMLRSSFHLVGIGVAKSPSGAWYLVQNFGR